MKRIIFLPAIAALLCGACSSAVPEDYTQYVDPYIGTGDHGHVFMGANVPFGFVQLGPTSIPQTWDWCSGYNYADTTVIGFGHTHLSGTGIGDLNDISLMPVVGKVTPGRGTAGDPSSGMWSRFSRADERCAPGYYATRLLRYGIGVELTASPRVGMSRYAFPASDDAGIVLDLENGQGWDRSTDCGITACSDRTVEGWRYSTGWADDQRVYFHAEFSKPFERIVFTGADTLSADGRSARRTGRLGFGRRTHHRQGRAFGRFRGKCPAEHAGGVPRLGFRSRARSHPQGMERRIVENPHRNSRSGGATDLLHSALPHHDRAVALLRRERRVPRRRRSRYTPRHDLHQLHDLLALGHLPRGASPADASCIPRWSADLVETLRAASTSSRASSPCGT